MAELSRRGLLTGSWKKPAIPFRPPWSGDEHHFVDHCTRCNACITACETRVIERGAGGYPEVNFSNGECTFCYACASACPQALFSTRETTPWHYRIAVNDSCLARHQIECRSCEDTCETRAIRFRPTLSGTARPEIEPADCTACGACIAGCPASAIQMRNHDER
ncbi:ferredoxin-type protein NapF [Entomohabitans teleogrylli]|uniref:ferredoxin-type protein NapF n=1 Tax=Entomohabitans teleogrylli TaxID=1384589 RepID=UPI0008FC5F38|nr:ferredoxin-type protein NapF [Entomohabitans teleogrylli]